MAVLIDCNLTRCPFSGQVLDLDLLLFKLQYAGLFLYSILDQIMIERLSKEMSTALVCNKFSHNA